MKVVAFGEIMLRLSPPQHQTLTQATQLDCQLEVQNLMFFQP